MAQRTRRPQALDLTVRQLHLDTAMRRPLVYRFSHIGPQLEEEPMAAFRVVQRLACLSTPAKFRRIHGSAKKR